MNKLVRGDDDNDDDYGEIPASLIFVISLRGVAHWTACRHEWWFEVISRVFYGPTVAYVSHVPYTVLCYIYRHTAE